MNRKRGTSTTIEELANRIASLDSAQQQALLDRVAELNFQNGLAALSEMYRARLAREGKLEQTTEEVLTELRRIREQVAADDYRL